jgi:fluoride exporter
VTPLVLVAVGSMIGAPLRYLLDRAIQSQHERVFPFGTLVVNLSGSLALGIVLGLSASGGLSPAAVDAVGTGVIGAYTTFSTFSWETVRMLEEKSLLHATCNVAAAFGGGVAAAALGFWAMTIG